MKGGKRYWFKLYNNFFDNEKIKQIKRKKDGDRLIVIFINCLAITANCESGGYLKISENKFFTIETLAHHMGRNQKSIENALDIFQEYSMIVQDEYGYKKLDTSIHPVAFEITAWSSGFKALNTILAIGGAPHPAHIL